MEKEKVLGQTIPFLPERGSENYSAGESEELFLTLKGKHPE